jgi:phosphoesterase RecJ-like protein
VFFKVATDGEVRVSLRSKYDVNVRSVAASYGGGGHKNAAGFTAPGRFEDVRQPIIARVVAAIEEGMASRPTA